MTNARNIEFLREVAATVKAVTTPGSCRFAASDVFDAMRSKSLIRFANVEVILRLTDDVDLVFPEVSRFVSLLSGQMTDPMPRPLLPQRKTDTCDVMFSKTERFVWTGVQAEPVEVSGFPHKVIVVEFDSGYFVVDANEGQFSAIKGSEDMTYWVNSSSEIEWARIIPQIP